MPGQDAARRAPSNSDWKRRLACLLGAVVVLGACLMLRYSSETRRASAQARNSKARGVPASGQPTAGRSSTSAAAPQTATPDIVAVVNGQQINRRQLAQQCLRRFGTEVLESLVNKHLILQACRQQGVTVSQQEIDDEIVSISGKFGLSADRWVRMLAKERNITLAQYRRDIVWPTLALRRLAADKLTVSDEELQKAFEAEYGPKVQVRLIATSSQQKADRMLAKVKAAPDSFGKMAKDESEDPHSAAARGMIPPIRRHVGDAEVERVAFSLQPGDISPVIHVANQFLILKCEKRIPAANITPKYRQAASDQLRDQLADRKLRDAASAMFKELQTAARVVNVYNDAKLQEQLPGVAATINAQRITVAELSQACLARKGAEVLEGEIHRTLLSQALQKKGIAISEPELDAEIQRAAEAYGFVKKDGTADVDAWLKELTEQDGVTLESYVRDSVWPSVALKRLVGGKVAVTQDDLQKGFSANYGERVEILAIVLGNMRTAQEVFEMARGNPSRKFFGELAEQYSIEPVSRANYGEVPPIRRFSGQPAVEQEAFSLKPGELSGIVAVGDKYIIMKCLGRTRPVVETIDAVKDELVNDIREKKTRVAMAKEFERLQESAQIDNFLVGTTQSGRPSTAGPPAGNAQRPPQGPSRYPVSPASAASPPRGAPRR